MHLTPWILVLSLFLTSCVSPALSPEPEETSTITEARLVTGQVLDGQEGEIHYSYYLPENYDEANVYPMMVIMPGYDRMWFGEDSVGRNVDWNGFQIWLDRGMIVVSAQLTDWHERSARQAVELTEYMMEHFAVDASRVYAAGYSAGGETMSQAVSMRPDLYAVYVHAASQWDGTYAPVAENRVAVYIFMAENDEYYGSQKAQDAYDGLLSAYQETGLSDEEIQDLLRLQIPDNAWFNQRGVYNYHGGGSILFDEEALIDWVLQGKK